MTSLRTLDKLCLSLPCDYCQQPPDAPCVTSGGHRTSYPHSSRYRPIHEAWTNGFLDGARDLGNLVRMWSERGKGMKEILAEVERWTRD